ncbi:MAG: septation ring formation regulator EzrA [Candidatus Rokuibacteriota bacterium]|nr:MAG: septation ring formation regulator EzrA [Candidatus Rokubacteria bacterium]
MARQRRLREARVVKTRALGTTALALAALAILGYGGQSLARVWQMRREVETLERDIAALRVDTAELSATVERLRSDPELIERLARELLGLVKPDERVLKLPPAPGGQ